MGEPRHIAAFRTLPLNVRKADVPRPIHRQGGRVDYFTPEETALFTLLYTSTDLTMAQIAARLNALPGNQFNRTEMSCRNKRTALALPLRKRKPSGQPLVLSEDQLTEFRAMWMNDDPIPHIQRAFGISSATVQKYRVRLGLPGRKRSGKKKHINFSMLIDTPMNRAMHRRATERNCSVNEYVRYLIRRDCGL